MSDQPKTADNPSAQTPPAPPPPRRSGRLGRLGKRALAILISTTIALLLAEFVVRLVAPQVLSVPILDYVDGIACNQADVSGRSVVPGLFDVTYRTSSQRFRGTRQYQTKPPEDVLRIAAIGDSFCFGVGAEDDQSYPTVLENRLNGSGRRVEIINAGVGGTGTGVQALWYDRWVRQFSPRLVIWTIYFNDVEDDLITPVFAEAGAGEVTPVPLEERLRRAEPIMAARRKVHRVPFYSFLAEHSHLVNLVRRIGSQSLGRTTDAATTQAAAALNERFKSEGLGRMAKELRWLEKNVESSGAKLVVAWFPARESIYPEATPYSQSVRSQSDQIVGVLSDFSKERGVPLFNPIDALKAHAAGRSDELYYKGRDSHPRPEGYRIFAEELARFLDQRGLAGK